MSQVADALALAAAALGGTPRAGQEEMALAVAECLATAPRARRGDGPPAHLLVQAGTGTGKSLAYLTPAALHAASGRPVVISTATLALQRQLVERDLPVVSAALEPLLGRPLTYAVLKGRHNYVCKERLHRAGDDAEDDDAIFAAPRTELGRQAIAVRQWALETQTGDRDEYGEPIDARVWRGLSVARRECVGESKCAFGEECFTARRREIAMQADIVVTNHAMLAIHYVEGIPVLPEHDALVVDEAHELVDRMTQALTMELSARAVETAAGRARAYITAEALDDLLAAGEELAEALKGIDGRFREPGRDLTLALTRVRDAARVAVGQIGSEDDLDTLAARQRARGALDEVFDAAGRLLAATPQEVTWGDGSGTACLAPLDVSGLMRNGLFAERPAVLTSATLTAAGGFDAVATALGLQPGDLEWQGLDVGSPFDYARQGILYVARHLPPPGREGIPEESLDEVGALIEAAGGRTLVLCSSWRAVERIGDYLRVRGVEDVLVQRRGDTVAPLVERFAAERDSSLVGTLSLWQGVDVPGATCSLVIIDRIPFPRPDDPVVSARQDAVDAAGGSGFAAVSLPRAGLMLAQGAGRLIRDTADRGVVAVLDPRLATAGYARRLRDSLPPLWFTTDREAALGALRRLREEVRPGG
ncbi:MAG: ATP-dependent DNA helicase [Candidatus Nanopelagicales bacterium]